MNTLWTPQISIVHIKYNGMNYVSFRDKYGDSTISLNTDEMERLIQWWREKNPEASNAEPIPTNKI